MLLDSKDSEFPRLSALMVTRTKLAVDLKEVDQGRHDMIRFFSEHSTFEMLASI